MDLQQYVGIPFKAKGRRLNGMDCYGLLRWFYFNEYNIQLVSYEEDYKHTEDFDAIMDLVWEEQNTTWRKVPREEVQFGDAIVLNYAGCPIHMGIVVGGTKMLHVLEGRDSCIETFDNWFWRKRIYGFFRHPKVPSGCMC